MEFELLIVYAISGMLSIMGVFAVFDWLLSTRVCKKEKRILNGSRIMIYNEKTGNYEPVKFN